MKTAKALGLDAPPAVLLRADEVIEWDISQRGKFGPPTAASGHSVRFREVRCHVSFLQHRKCAEGRKWRDGP